MTRSKNSPPKRLERVDDRGYEVAQELLAIEDEEMPEKTIVGDEEFNHQQWMLAELKEADEELTRYLSLMRIDGTIKYE